MGLVRKIDEFGRNAINNYFFYNRWLEPFIESVYYAPDKKNPQIPISDTTQKYLEEFRENGVVIIPNFNPAAADAIDEAYFQVLEGKKKAAPGREIDIMDLGERNAVSNTVSAKVSFRDPVLEPVLWDREICGLIYNYYRRQPFYRDQTTVYRNAPTASVSQEVEIASKFHLDLYHQITTQFLVKDLTAGDTRLQYAAGSHVDRKFSRDRYSFEDADVAKRYRIVDCVGPKGSLVIMDAGAGLHRGTYVPGTVRKMVHTLITTGHSVNIYGKSDSLEGWEAYKHFPPFMQHMMDRVKK